MKQTKIVFGLCLIILASISSCKKADKQTDANTETYALTTDDALTENLTSEDDAVLFEATASRNLQGNDFTGGTADRLLTGCAIITVTPQTGFPKLIVIDFGTGCTYNGVTRKGKININLSDSLRRPGSTAVMTFDNYFVNNFKREGIITHTNTSTATEKSWRRKVENGKITAPDGRFWIHNSIHAVVQTAGLNTPGQPLDDEFTIRGQSSHSNSNGLTRTCVITIPLLKKVSCENIVSGRKRMEVPNHTVVLDYGNGACDRIATISIDGGPIRTILLR